MYYSATTLSFYPPDLRRDYERAGSWPEDAVLVDSEEYAQYGQGQPPPGMQRGADADGRPAWVSIPHDPIETLATRKLTTLEQALSDALAAGMPYTMPDGTEEVVQTRPEDEPNLLGLAIEARDLRAAGETGAVQQLRTLSNKVYDLTPQQMIDLTDAAKRLKKQQLDKSWVLKDRVRDTVADKDLSDDEQRTSIEAVTW